MNILILVIGLSAGALTGVILTRLILKERFKSQIESVKSEFAAEISSLKERIVARDASIADLKVAIVKSESETKSEKIKLSAIQNENTILKESISELKTIVDKERKASEEKLALINEAEKKLSDAFKALSAESLKNNNQAFLDLAKSSLEKYQETAKNDLEKRQTSIGELVKPIRETLDKFDVSIKDIEKQRLGAYKTIEEQIKSLHLTNADLRKETGNLVKALKQPIVRGRWGEIQLRKVVEMAGMVNYVDFNEQVSQSTETGRIRPDMVVKLPNNRTIVVDSKAPIDAYLDAANADDENIRSEKLALFARHIQTHIKQLSSKAYWSEIDATTDFVVMFLPGEHFFSAALEQNPALIEEGVNNNVILATPTTLISLLKAVSYGWRQEEIALNARMISELGCQLYDRIHVFAKYFKDIGSGLDKAVESYNKAVTSIETRLLTAGRKFKDLGIDTSKGEIDELEQIDIKARAIQAEELIKWEKEEGEEEPVRNKDIIH